MKTRGRRPSITTRSSRAGVEAHPLRRACIALLAGLALSGAGLAAPASAPDRKSVVCGQASVGRVARTGPDRLRYCGPLDRQGAQRLERRLRPGDRVLEIASPGGELDWPLRIAQTVRDRGLSVEVIGACYSGCASFVFPAGKARRIIPGGLLGFHNTASGVLAALEVWGEGVLSAEEAAPLRARAAGEVALYRSVGVSEAMLVEPLRRIGLRCLVRSGAHPETGEPVILIGTERTLWAPSASDLSAAGMTFEGVLPADQGRVSALFHTLSPSLRKKTDAIVYGAAAEAPGDWRFDPDCRIRTPPE